ncbi:MAG: hypothetical protein C4586_02540 [Anaerolineaceae bacterium]|nr:MAG: hypothetical protein C4586_02540 [Anaerolineaceae bacterium]
MTKKNIPFLLLFIACVFVTIYIFHPGYMDNDAVDQFEQGGSGLYNDWHPPLMSWLWGRLDQIVPGTLGIFTLQVILFWSGLGILISMAAPNLKDRLLYLLLGFFPPAFMLLSTIIKDVAMAGALIFGFSLILYSEKRRSILLFVSGLVFLGYGMVTRHNATLAAFPLFLYSGIALAKIYSSRTGAAFAAWKSVTLGLALFIIVFAAGNLGARYLTKIKSYPIQQIMLHDLVGISIRTKTNLIPQYLAVSEQPSMKDLRQIYQLGSMKNLYWPDFTPIHFKIIHDPILVGDLFDTWIREVVKHPRAYLDHRWKVFAAVLNIKGGKTCGPYYYEETIYKPKGFYKNDSLDNYYSDNPVTNRLFGLIEPLRNSLIYRNWLYVLFSMVLFVISFFIVLKFRSTETSLAKAALALSASGSLYSLAYFFVATTCDFRMVYWNVVVTLTALIFLLNSFKRKRRES